MPDQQALLDQIDRLDQEATPGPWTTDSTPDEFGIIWGAVEQIGGGFGERAMVTEIMEEHADAEFIALARTALPQLAKALQAVMKVLDEEKIHHLGLGELDPGTTTFSDGHLLGFYRGRGRLVEEISDAITGAIKEAE